MSTFFVLPPREVIEHAFQEFVSRILPGLPVPVDMASLLLSRLTADRDETVFLHREELPDVQDTPDLLGVLQDAYGAGPGDRVVEVGPLRTLGQSSVRESVILASVSVRPPV